MGRCVGKCEEEEEIVDPKIRTRAMAEVKRMKMMTTKKVSVSVSASTTPYNVYELRIRRLRNNSVSSPVILRNETTTFEDTTISTSSTGSEVVVNCSDFPASFCSRNFASSSSPSSSSKIVKNCGATSPEIVADLEVESGGETLSKCNKAAREVESNGLDYQTTKSTVQIKSLMMPSESEIEDFFSSAEKDLQKRFSDKYNYDILKDVPLEGRYEWVEIKP